MIHDFVNTFEERQAVKVRAVPIGSSRRARHLVGMVATGAMVLGVVGSLTFCLLIRSGLKELAAMQETKIELMKKQQTLYAERKVLMSGERIEAAAAEIGLHVPGKGQVRRI